MRIKLMIVVRRGKHLTCFMVDHECLYDSKVRRKLLNQGVEVHVELNLKIVLHDKCIWVVVVGGDGSVHCLHVRESDYDLLDGVSLRYTQLIDPNLVEGGEGGLENERLGGQLARMMSGSEVGMLVQLVRHSIDSKERVAKVTQMSSRHVVSVDAGLEVDVVDLHLIVC